MAESAPSPEDIRSRWNSELSAVGIRSLMGSGASPFPQLVDGRRDLRGLTINEIVKNARIDDADLSGCVTEGFGQFGMCHVSSCVFNEAKLTTNLGTDFQECNFSFAQLPGVVMRGRFLNCDFSSANLTSALGSQVRFIGCKFKKTNLTKATLAHCLFEECEFADCRFRSGSLASSRFVRTPMTFVELGNTLMEKVVFSE